MSARVVGSSNIYMSNGSCTATCSGGSDYAVITPCALNVSNGSVIQFPIVVAAGGSGAMTMTGSNGSLSYAPCTLNTSGNTFTITGSSGSYGYYITVVFYKYNS